MSGPKCGEYSVVSEAELRRRRLAAAQDRYERASSSATNASIAIRGALATYPGLDLAEPVQRRPKSDDPAEWERAASDLEARAVAALDRMNTAVASRRASDLAARFAGLTVTFAPDAPRVRRTTQQAATSPATPSPLSRPERLTATLSLLPADSARSDECEQLARQWHDAESDERRELVLSSIKLIVQTENDLRRAIARNRAAVDELLSELDGLESDEVTELGRELQSLNLTMPPAESLRQRVAEVRAAAVNEMDRVYVLSAVESALEELGYSVGGDFAIAAPDGGAIVDLTTSARHGVRIAEQGGQLRFNVVRYDDPRDAQADTAAEEAFCSDFRKLRTSLAGRGIDIGMLREDRPGQTRMMKVARRSERAHQPATAKKAVSKARSK